MKRINHLFFFLLLVGSTAAAQTPLPDSLLRYSLPELEQRYQVRLEEGNLQEALLPALAMVEKKKREGNAQDTTFARYLYQVADLYEYMGDIENALLYLEQSIAIQKVKIPRHADYGKSLHLLGILYRNKGDYDQAETAYTQALSIRKTALGEKHPRYAATLYNLGLLYCDKGEYARAETYYKQALAIRKEVLGEDHPEYAASLTNLGILYYNLGQHTQAENFYVQALGIQKEVLGEAHPDYAANLNNLAMLYDYSGDYSRAETFYLRALEIQKTVWGEQHPDYAASLDNLGLLYDAKGDYIRAEEYFQQSLAIKKQILGEKHPDYAKTVHNIGNLYADKGDYAKAEYFFLQALSIKKETIGEEHPDYAASLGNIGILYYDMGDYAKAENFYLRALAIEQRTYGEKHPRYAITLNSLGVLYHEMRQYAKAEQYYRKALDIEREALGLRHPDYAKSLNNLAILYNDMGDRIEAERFYTQALQIQKEIHGAKHPTYAQSLNNLGNLYLNMGDLVRAERFYKEALVIFKEILGEKHPTYTAGLNNLAALYLSKNQRDLAWTQLLAAIQSNSGVSLPIAITQEGIAQLRQASYVAMDNINKSLLLVYGLLDADKTVDNKNKKQWIIELALDLLERDKNELSEEEDKLRILAQSNEWVQKSMRILDPKLDADIAFQLVEKNKSVLLLDAVSNKRAQTFGILPDSLVQKEKLLQKEYTQTQAALSEKRSTEEWDSLRRRWTDLNLQINAFQKQIQEKYPKYASLKYQYDVVKASDIQALLGKETALLEYLVGDTSLYAFYVDAQQIQIYSLPIDKDTLQQKIEALHKSLSSYGYINKNPDQAYRNYTRTAHWFYAQLVAPVLGSNQPNRLIIIPDGELGHLPFETFLVEPAPKETSSYADLHYLLRDMNISYHYSATLWKENKLYSHRQHNRQLLAMAAAYGPLPDSARLAASRLPEEMRLRELLQPLPAAQDEVHALADHFSGLFTFENQSVERLFKQKAPQYGIIHLAMHGILNQKDQILSSLAFTEDGDEAENNFLYAHEISKMELNADLVVLSACETGFGKFERGNGIASLARAFLYAGVPALVVSLWSVNDMSTGKLMQYFYQNIADGMEKDEALRQAKLQYLSNARGVAAHPAYWSPFIQMGNTESIQIERKGSHLGWLWWTLGGLSLVSIFFFIRRKREL